MLDTPDFWLWGSVVFAGMAACAFTLLPGWQRTLAATSLTFAAASWFVRGMLLVVEKLS